MAGKGFKQTWTPTSVGGSILQAMSAWTQIVNGSCLLKQVIIVSTRPDTQFSFRIMSPALNAVYDRKDINNILNEKPDVPMIRGIYSLYIYNVTNGAGVQVDDTFSAEFMFEDKKDR